MRIREILQRVGEVIGSQSNRDIAKSLGVGESTVSTWKNRNTIPLEELDNFAYSKGISLEWLLVKDKYQKQRETLQNIKFYEQNRRASDQFKLQIAQEKNIDLDADLEHIFTDGSEELKDYLTEVIHLLASKSRSKSPRVRRSRK